MVGLLTVLVSGCCAFMYGTCFCSAVIWLDRERSDCQMRADDHVHANESPTALDKYGIFHNYFSKNLSCHLESGIFTFRRSWLEIWPRNVNCSTARSSLLLTRFEDLITKQIDPHTLREKPLVPPIPASCACPSDVSSVWPGSSTPEPDLCQQASNRIEVGRLQSAMTSRSAPSWLMTSLVASLASLCFAATFWGAAELIRSDSASCRASKFSLQCFATENLGNYFFTFAKRLRLVWTQLSALRVAVLYSRPPLCLEIL